MLTATKLRAAAAATGLVVSGGLAIAAAVALATAPLTPRLAIAQSAANQNDQPTAGTLPSGTSTVKGGRKTADEPTGQVSPPSEIQSSTGIIGSPDGKRTDPLEHLSPSNRRSGAE